MPALDLAACRIGRSWLPPRAWTDPDTDPALREAAREVCRSCPVQGPCLAWSLRAVDKMDDSIVAGVDARERARLRRMAR